ncbi:ATP-binding cassette domain-containing protein [Shinella sp. CPCC 101442]|uniref:ATP-binding cassette domain-containing protein n=1 Tax=Shinella sp. CPCC 101442 TaxID=2932265 RepID=UPI002152AB41|nr:ATP-binding cassette domain-containing protein [Shinella sp. CPCC 101442]MCR6502800.1 ATP-binding cassette domain-containing protein [Shinella sp. CPCC 101442]
MIELEDVWKVFGTDERAVLVETRRPEPDEDVLKRLRAVVGVRGASLCVKKGELVCLMGLSGSGKSTLVRLVNRLLEPSTGRVRIDGSDILSIGPKSLRELRSRRIGMVFQSHALLAHLSVRDNVALPLEIRGVARTQREDRADELLVRVGLEGLGDRRITALSGGMQQRVGLARALAADPDILLMDEPFSALDPLIRHDLQTQFMALSRELGKTTVFVTHDVDEAFRIADRVVLMRAGRIVQVGTADTLLSQPADDYVRRFVQNARRPALSDFPPAKARAIA